MLRQLDAVSVALCSVLDPAALCVARTTATTAAAASSSTKSSRDGGAQRRRGAGIGRGRMRRCNDLPRRRGAGGRVPCRVLAGPGISLPRARAPGRQLLFATDFDESVLDTRACVDAARVAAAVGAAAPGCASASGDSVDLFDGRSRLRLPDRLA